MHSHTLSVEQYCCVLFDDVSATIPMRGILLRFDASSRFLESLKINTRAISVIISSYPSRLLDWYFSLLDCRSLQYLSLQTAARFNHRAPLPPVRCLPHENFAAGIALSCGCRKKKRKNSCLALCGWWGAILIAILICPFANANISDF